jgi:predicted XRE-type DNA-binding protein
MKISHVAANSRKRPSRCIRPRGLHEVPFAKLRLVPSSENRVTEVFVDSELGDEAFTYRLESGEEDTLHFDAVLELNADPDHLQDLLLHKLAVEARKGLEASGLSKRQIARQLGTSPSQLYRLLDPANPRHSVGQLLAVLDLVGKEVDFVVRPRSKKGSRRRTPATR